MTERAVAHATIVVEKTYDASPARVFEALRDPEARKQWGPPNDRIEIVFEATDFRVGGRDISWCGLKGAANFHVEAVYCDIVENSRVIFVETVQDAGVRLAVSLITFALTPDGGGTRLTLTDQIAGLDGSDMVSGSELGWGASMRNLTAYLAQTEGAAA
jgi:uncharacterized protein YndB with AHSA1/START domain